MSNAQLSDIFHCDAVLEQQEKMDVWDKSQCLSATSFRAGRFSIIALSAAKSAFCDHVLGCKSIKLEAAGRSFKSV